MSDQKKIKQNSVLQKRLFLAVSGGVFMSTMDSSMVNVALPTLMRYFRTSLAVTEWVVMVYLLTITVFLIVWGRACSRFGCGRIYPGGMSLFCLGSLLSGLAPNMGMLIFCRFAQALGGSMMMAAGPALIRLVFPPERLGRSLGLIGVATSLGLMTGPVVSGFLLEWLHWRAIFWVTVPVGAGLLLYGYPSLSRCATLGKDSATGPDRESGIDISGGMLWATLITLTVLASTRVAVAAGGESSFSVTTLFSGSLLLFAGWLFFFVHQRKKSGSLLPAELLRKRFLVTAILSSALSFSVLFIVLILMPFYLESILGFTPGKIGYAMMAVPVSVFLVSPLAGRLYDRYGARYVSSSGLACCLLALILLAGLEVDPGVPRVIGCLVLLGFGQAMFLSPNSASALGGVADEQAGITASLLATARNFGMLAGAALAGLSFSLHFAAASGGVAVQNLDVSILPAFHFAVSRTFTIGAVLSGAALLISWSRGGER